MTENTVPAQGAKPPAKAGIKTTEFWLTLAATVATAVSSMEIEGAVGKVVALAVMVLGVLGYTASRSKAKS